MAEQLFSFDFPGGALSGCTAGGVPVWNTDDCFYYVSTTMTQSAAEDNCNSTYGGHLASIHNINEWSQASNIARYFL